MDPSIGTAEYQEWVQLLRALRERAGLTQAQLAERIGERQAFVSAYERLQRRIDIREFREILVALGEPAAPLVDLLDSLRGVMAALANPPT